MEQYKFKKGDLVERICGYHVGMKTGDRSTIIGLVGGYSLKLKDYNTSNECCHDPKNFKLAISQPSYWW